MSSMPHGLYVSVVHDKDTIQISLGEQWEESRGCSVARLCTLSAVQVTGCGVVRTVQESRGYGAVQFENPV